MVASMAYGNLESLTRTKVSLSFIGDRVSLQTASIKATTILINFNDPGVTTFP